MNVAGIGANVAQTAAGQIMKYMNSTTHLDYSGVVTVLMSICIGMCKYPAVRSLRVRFNDEVCSS